MIEPLSNLANMLHRAGVIGEEEAAAASSRARDRGGSVVASLVELGLAKEGQLVGFVQSKLMIPQVTPGILSVLERPAIDAIDRETAWRHEILPVSVDDVGNLTLAMADPTDLAAVDAVVSRTHAYVIRAVAPRTALLRALNRFYGPPPAPVEVDATGHRTPPPGGTDPGSPVVLPDPRPAPSDSIAGTIESPMESAPPRRGTPSRPLPLIDDFAPLSAAAFGRVLPKLVEAADRDEITTVLLEFLAEGFDRVILFVNTQGMLRGRDCRGEDLMIEAVRQVRIPMSGPSTFSQVVDTGTPYFGRWRTDNKIDAMFGTAMGSIQGNVLVLPVKLGVRVPLLVFASNTPHPVDPRSLNELVDGVAGALERLILARKSRELPKIEG